VENAALDQPYANQPGYLGELQWEPGELAEAAGRAVRAGWKVGVHAWGDHAVRATRCANGSTKGRCYPPDRTTPNRHHTTRCPPYGG
jgi:hypothetical protein